MHFVIASIFAMQRTKYLNTKLVIQHIAKRLCMANVVKENMNCYKRSANPFLLTPKIQPTQSDSQGGVIPRIFHHLSHLFPLQTSRPVAIPGFGLSHQILTHPHPEFLSQNILGTSQRGVSPSRSIPSLGF